MHEPRPVTSARLVVSLLLVWAGSWSPRVEAADPLPARRSSRLEKTTAERSETASRLRELYRGPPAGWPAATIDPGVEWRELGLLPLVEHPESNPPNEAKTALGRLLFHDPRLSASGQLACVSCHDPARGWADGRAVSQPSHGIPARNAPTIRNAAWQSALFWDGRAATLERQVEESLTNPTEMAADPDHVVALLSQCADYRKLFAKAFAGRAIDFAGVVDALASFERTVVGGRSRFDDFLRGDASALADAELLGLDLFRRDARCLTCHHGPILSDGRFHDVGLSFYGRPNEDLGRYAVTTDPADIGRFRTPSLRDATQTQPLTHTGMFELPGLLAMYNAGMPALRRHPHQEGDPLFPVKSPHLRPLGLNGQDLGDLAAFLAALAEPVPRSAVRSPDLPRSDAPAVAVER